jgi:hypothetical protein
VKKIEPWGSGGGMTTDVDSPLGKKGADTPAATPEMRRPPGPHDAGPADSAADGPAGVLVVAPADVLDAVGAGASAEVLDAAGVAAPAAADRSVQAPQTRPLQQEEMAPEDETFFRFPAAGDPDPGWRRLLGMSVYAAILGLAAVGVGVRGLAAAVGGDAPGWYVPVLAFAGMLSVGLSVAAFLSIHRYLLPWLLLLAAAVPMGTAVILAVVY